MTRMSREFSLVLLGAGVLTAGYFAAPSPDDEVQEKANEQAAARTGHTTHHRGGTFLFIHSMGYAGTGTGGGRTVASPSVSRGGFGGIGHAAGAGGS